MFIFITIFLPVFITATSASAKCIFQPSIDCAEIKVIIPIVHIDKGCYAVTYVKKHADHFQTEKMKRTVYFKKCPKIDSILYGKLTSSMDDIGVVNGTIKCSDVFEINNSCKVHDSKNSACCPKQPTIYPHGEAIRLVLKLHTEYIANLEKDITDTGEAMWWFDTINREWHVQRSYAPGVIDTTQLLLVSYKKSGKILAQWNVDLAKRVAILIQTEIDSKKAIQIATSCLALLKVEKKDDEKLEISQMIKDNSNYWKLAIGSTVIHSTRLIQIFSFQNIEYIAYMNSSKLRWVNEKCQPVVNLSGPRDQH